MTTVPEALPARWLRYWKWPASWERFRYPLAVYAASRLLYFLVAIADSVAQNANLKRELSNWDGHWYVLTGQYGYYHHIFTLRDQYTTLGFLPLFPMLEWLVSSVAPISVFGAGLALSLITGATATLLVTQLAQQWWGEAAARRALLFWCFFPGTIVFSMVYPEGLTISLVAGVVMLLSRKRWVWAGVLAGFATAVEPVALAVIPVCAVAALMEIRERGWSNREARRSLLAPILSPWGVVGFGIFLWFWCGTPLASLKAQHGAWAEVTTPLAIPDVFGSLIHQIFIHGVIPANGPGGIDLNGILALLGTAFLLYGLWRLWQVRRTIPIPVWVWVVVTSLLALSSAKTPPNPRLLICTFPVVLLVGAKYSGRAQKWLMAANIGCLLVLSWFTFVGAWLRP
jgi:hypothetical protein